MSYLKYCVVFIALLSIGGCGESDSKIRIKGVVFADDKPLEGASIAFIGNSGGSISSAISNEKGEFSLRAAPGKNKVAVSKDDPSAAAAPADPHANQTMPTEAEYAKMVKAAPKSLVAERFKDPEKSGISIDVSEGMDVVDINVSSK